MKLSIVGTVLASVYLATTVGILIYAFTCKDMFCGVIAVLPIIHWIMLAPYIGFSWYLYVILVLLDIAILYAIGCEIDKWKKGLS